MCVIDNSSLGTIPGDVIIIVSEKEHDVFKRKGSLLLMFSFLCVYIYTFIIFYCKSSS